MKTSILEKLIVCDLLNWPLKTSNNLWTGPNYKTRTYSDSSLITSVSFLPLKFNIQQVIVHDDSQVTIVKQWIRGWLCLCAFQDWILYKRTILCLDVKKFV